jgi:membrane protein implicated in regulation of membrane protease activity
MQQMKLMILILAIVGQFAGLILLFIDVKWAITVYLIYAALLLVLLFLFIKERRKEKKEEAENDYSDY